MAAECSQEAILDFLREKGGRVKNADFVEHFKGVFPEEPEKKAAARNTFKNHVDNVALVKTESGVKYVCLKKKFRGSAGERHVSNGTHRGAEPVRVLLPGGSPACRRPAGPGGADGGQVSASDARRPAQQTLPGSGYGSDSRARVPHVCSPARIPPDEADDKSRCHEFVCVVEEVDGSAGEMGNRGSLRRDRRESKKERAVKGPDIPEIAVIEASPLPAEGSVFALPGPLQTGPTAPGLSPRDRQVETESPSPGGLKEAEQIQQPGDRGDEEQLDTHSLSGSEGEGSVTPKGSRRHFLKVMMDSSPQVRRSMVLRSSVHLSSRSDSDSASLVSCSLDDDRTSVTLDPLEHEWMMCASDGEWGSLSGLLAAEPGLVLRKDFVTGFTCLHWAAKQGKPELMALIINFAKQHNVPISVDVRSNTGYTPLHIAAMHNHMEVVKLLVGAYNADVEIRDYSGRKACQYLTDSVSVDIQDIIGAYERCNLESADRRDGGRWRFSKILQSNLKPLRLLNPNDCDSVDGDDGPREKPLRRRSSLSGMKPKLQRLRLRTSQIVHSTSFRDTDGSGKGSFKSRPKTHFFG